MPEEWENAIEWLDGQKTATVTLHSQKLLNRVMKLQKEYPDKVKIVAGPKENGGYLLAHVPAAWLKIEPKRKVELTEERKAELAERMRVLREKQSAAVASKSAPKTRRKAKEV